MQSNFSLIRGAGGHRVNKDHETLSPGNRRFHRHLGRGKTNTCTAGGANHTAGLKSD